MIHLGNESVEIADRREAVEALRWLTQQDDVQGITLCSWEIRLPAHRLPEEIDFPGQMYGPCSALLVETSRGWHCAHGHEHVSGAEYYEEDEVRHLMQDGYLVPQDAYYMDGRPVF